jgi:hypothetical protein
MMRLKSKLLTIILFVAPIFAVHGYSKNENSAVLGKWNGTWIKNNDALPVILTIGERGGALYGTFDSDELQAVGIPFSNVSLTGNSLHLTLVGDQTKSKFDGTVRGDTITGTFTDGSDRGTFRLVHAPALSNAVERVS